MIIELGSCTAVRKLRTLKFHMKIVIFSSVTVQYMMQINDGI